jgi:molecular chaperone DnaK (HSP70)
MAKKAAIDLGTCYSVVVVPGEHAGERFQSVRECPGHSIVLDGFKNRLTPSVVAEVREKDQDQGKILVGHTAKARAGLAPEPIMFAKRSMGEEKAFVLSGDQTDPSKVHTAQPEEISAEILRYLKGLAEDALGEPVTEAVVTVPAWFGMRPQQMTEKAAHLAGFTKVQLLQEPVAAALVYSANDPQKNLRILTYDLGGGTFDVAILDKIDGTISNESIRDFDGDHFLGGYNFDELLVRWLLEQLNERGYKLRLDRSNPADNVIYAKLMIYAERAKIALSQRDSYEFTEQETGISDHAGNPVAIDNLVIGREDFETMISSLIAYSTSLCDRVIARVAAKEGKAKKIDQIVLVGGSSRIPLVARMLEAKYAMKPRLFLPDLAVALGASIVAAATSGPPVDGCLELDRIPTETDSPGLLVTGHVVPATGLPAVAGCTVTLKASDGSFDAKRVIREDGGFRFSDDHLAPLAQTDFVLQVLTPAGAIAKTHRFSVKQVAEAKRHVIAPDPVLAKPMKIQCREGFRTIAPAGVRLPSEWTVDQATTDTSGVIRVPLWEQEHLLGEIVLKDIDSNLPVGSTVQVSLTIDANFQIRGRAHVPQLGREATLVVVIPPPCIKAFEDLRKRYEMLSALGDETVRSLPPGVVFGNSDVDMLQTQLKRCEEIFRHESARDKCSELQEKLDEIADLIRRIRPVKLTPPLDFWKQKHEEAGQLLKEAIAKDEKTADAGYAEQLAAICAEGEKAYADKNQPAWTEANHKLDEVSDNLRRIITPPPRGDGPMDTLLALAQMLEKVDKRIEALPEPRGEVAKQFGTTASVSVSEKDVVERIKALTGAKEWREAAAAFRAECKLLAGELRKITPSSANWQGQAWGWRNKVDDLNSRIDEFVKRVASAPQDGLTTTTRKS